MDTDNQVEAIKTDHFHEDIRDDIEETYVT